MYNDNRRESTGIVFLDSGEVVIGKVFVII